MANPGSFLAPPKVRATPQAVTPTVAPTKSPPMTKPSMGAPQQQQRPMDFQSMNGGSQYGTDMGMSRTQGAPQQFNQMGGPMYPPGPSNPGPANPGGSSSGGTSFQLPPWSQGTTMPSLGNNSMGQPNDGAIARTRMPMQNDAPGQSGGFFGDLPFYDKNQYGANDNMMSKYISSVLPVAQFEQNNYQYAHDSNEAQRRYNLDHGLAENQNQFQQGLSTRQQMSAEEQARVAAQQWGQQFQHTSQMDMLGYGLSQGQLADQQQQTKNTGQYQRGLNQNQAFANQSTAQYQQGLVQNQGYANNTDRLAQGATQQYQQGLVQNQGYANQTQRQDVNNQFSLGQGANANQAQANNIQQMYDTGQISLGNRNAALAELTQGQNNSFLQQQFAQQSQQAELDRQAQLQMANINAYGRSTPGAQATWARGWG